MTDPGFDYCDRHRWFDWPKWGLAIGSDKRYKPRWWERQAYIAGLRDAARIAEAHRFIRPPVGHPVERMGVTPVIKAIHAYVLDFLGLPPDPRRYGE